jgi:hypothetical protein
MADHRFPPADGDHVVLSPEDAQGTHRPPFPVTIDDLVDRSLDPKHVSGQGRGPKLGVYATKILGAERPADGLRYERQGQGAMGDHRRKPRLRGELLIDVNWIEVVHGGGKFCDLYPTNGVFFEAG